MVQFGQYPPPALRIAHFSDAHLLAGGRPLADALDTESTLDQALRQLERSGAAPAALVFTGDLTDLGEPDAYARLRALVEPAAERMGTTVVWVMGNHDERAAYQAGLFDETGTDAPQDRVVEIAGLRIVVLDSTVPGYHHGDIDDAQFAWLEGVLAHRAPRGTLLALHHPPIPSPVEVMAILELRRQDRLAEVLTGTDVRGILAGHLHYSTHSTFAGIPVSVASATCYAIDVSAPPHTLSGVAGGQAFGLVSVYDDRLVHEIVPLGPERQVSGFGERFLAGLSTMTPEERTEAFSSKSSRFTPADLEALGG